MSSKMIVLLLGVNMRITLTPWPWSLNNTPYIRCKMFCTFYICCNVMSSCLVRFILLTLQCNVFILASTNLSTFYSLFRYKYTVIITVMKIKIKLKTYQCKVCQKPFANRQNVSRHRKLNPPCRDKPSDKPVIEYTCICAKCLRS